MPSTENGGVSTDGPHWRLKLRPDVTRHDGTPFTADDVKFTIDPINDKNFSAISKAGHELVQHLTIVICGNRRSS